jgi:tetratricopeptide (TPR) repeat protein
MKPAKKPGKIPEAAAADEMTRRAVAIMQSGRPDEAERILRGVLAKAPRAPAALHSLGLALLQQRRPQDAIAPLEEAARQCSDPVIETNLAIALDQCKRTADALAWLQRATTRQPPFEHAFCELGRLLLSLRRFDEAEAVLERGLQVAPNLAELSVLLGGLFLERDERDRARLAFARALVNAPGHPGALGGMGAVLMHEGDFARAAERFVQALARDPTDVQARLCLGACQLELRRLDEGLASLRAAIQMAPPAYAMALKILVTSGRGRFWLKPSTAMGQLLPARRA